MEILKEEFLSLARGRGLSRPTLLKNDAGWLAGQIAIMRCDNVADLKAICSKAYPGEYPDQLEPLMMRMLRWHTGEHLFLALAKSRERA